MTEPHANAPSNPDSEKPHAGFPIGKHPANSFSLRTNLGPVIGYLYELRLGGELPDVIRSRLRCINLALVEIVDDDEMGMIEASSQQCIRCAESDR